VTDWIVATGTTSLGLLIGAIVGWYFSEAQKTTLTVLTSSIAAIAGAPIVAMLKFLAEPRGPTHEFWLYPVGVLIGFVIVIALELRHYDYYGQKRQ
jgi:hypothetical protein